MPKAKEKKMLYQTKYASLLGTLSIVSDDCDIVGLWIEGQRYFQEGLREEPLRRDDAPPLLQAKRWLDAYFAGERPKPETLPLAPAGSDFRKAVWRRLMEIPFGGTAAYGEIAQRLAQDLGREKMSARAVGGAVGHNPISIIIPCHRVIGADGGLTGYAGGLDAKRRLLQFEGVKGF